jgi:hypothetical protein
MLGRVPHQGSPVAFIKIIQILNQTRPKSDSGIRAKNNPSNNDYYLANLLSFTASLL